MEIAELVTALLRVWRHLQSAAENASARDTGAGPARRAKKGGRWATPFQTAVSAPQPYCDEALFVASLLAEAFLARVTLRRGFSWGGSSLPKRLKKVPPPLLLGPLLVGLLLATPANV